MNKPTQPGREAALAVLKRQIAEQRARLDPRILQRAAEAAALSQQPAAVRAAGLVPYDREAATEAVRLFLQDHPEADAFERRLRAFLASKTH